jgi:predicted HD superfamily hydrolase involved in NAD metabolism
VGVWHAYLSAYLAEHDFGVADPAVLRAIRLHPTAEAEMSALDRIIFMADYIEPTRRFAGLNELRELAEGDLDKAFRTVLEQKLLFIQMKDRPLHPRALRALAAVGGHIREVESSFPSERRHGELPASKTK